jgi:lycopene cyclase domain-containing protein
MGHWTYFALELVWAGPIVVMQWLLGLDVLLRRWKVWLPGILLPSLYLTFADSFAIGSHTWTINPDLSLNIFLPLGVPLEELLFFLLTNALVVQGLILVLSPGVSARTGRLIQVIRRGPQRWLSERPKAPVPPRKPLKRGQS